MMDTGQVSGTTFFGFIAGETTILRKLQGEVHSRWFRGEI
jgi:hypothetical protein